MRPPIPLIVITQSGDYIFAVDGFQEITGLVNLVFQTIGRIVAGIYDDICFKRIQFF